MAAPVNEQLHELLTALDQLASRPEIAELDLARPAVLLAGALTEQRLDLVNARAELRQLRRANRVLAGALLAIDARRTGAPLMPVAIAVQLRELIAEAIAAEEERDTDHTPAPPAGESVNQLHADGRAGVLTSHPAPGTRRGDWSQGRDDQTAAPDVGSTPAAQDA